MVGDHALFRARPDRPHDPSSLPWLRRRRPGGSRRAASAPPAKGDGVTHHAVPSVASDQPIRRHGIVVSISMTEHGFNPVHNRCNGGSLDLALDGNAECPKPLGFRLQEHQCVRDKGVEQPSFQSDQ